MEYYLQISENLFRNTQYVVCALPNLILENYPFHL